MRRRTLLVGGLAVGAGAAGLGLAAADDRLPGETRVRRALGLDGPDGAVPAVPAGAVRVDSVVSRARGRRVELAIMLPAGHSASGLDAVVALPGRSGSARAMVDFGLPQFLTAAVRAGVPPFALVSLGDADYWNSRTPGDDPQAMLAEELPGWLAARGLGGTVGGAPRAAFGISAGGFGALRYARSRPDLAAVAGVSAAMFLSWSDASSRHEFTSEADWQANEPLRHVDELRVPLGVWCGAEDPFVTAARRLAKRGHAEVAAFASGAHATGYWRRVMPDVLRFIGDRLRSPAASPTTAH